MMPAGSRPDTCWRRNTKDLPSWAAIPGVSVSQDRYAGFRDTLAEAGVLLRAAEFCGDNTYGRALDASRDLFNQRELPDSVFCVNDQIAVAAIDAAREVGLSIPNDLGVIGVDDIWMAQTGSYSLTTVAQPLEGNGSSDGGKFGRERTCRDRPTTAAALQGPAHRARVDEPEER